MGESTSGSLNSESLPGMGMNGSGRGLRSTRPKGPSNHGLGCSHHTVDELDDPNEPTEAQLALGYRDPETLLDLALWCPGGLAAGMYEQRAAIAERASAVLDGLNAGDDRPRVGLSDR